MRTLLLAVLATASVAAAPAKASVSDGTVSAVTECIQAAAALHRVPPGVIGNTNGTVGIGPMQVNEIHLPALARRWHTSVAGAREALLNNFCANVEAGAWILRREIDGAGGDFWEGVGRYHSRTEVHKTRYLRKVLEHVMRLQRIVLSPDRVVARR